jgi:hypothetical protein
MDKDMDAKMPLLLTIKAISFITALCDPKSDVLVWWFATPGRSSQVYRIERMGLLTCSEA